jgi:hypothetical protein
MLRQQKLPLNPLKGMLRRSIFKKKKEKRRVEREKIRKDEIEMQQINTNLTSPSGAWGRQIKQHKITIK